ncbi:hypothetical protein GIB67_038950 [Kingdonia uniflora]|uniref:Protein kinase domain-containing protein n=1 Tax=Kingdonia uniflora TaxID=39325 RepID=A0A7J7MSJ9_9MAGN|nr:hypothetical protein GIB67_038950 [Kingdonia uniflora]
MVIVTELLLGGTLRKYLMNLRPRCLDTRVAIGYALDIARAMECLHSHGIIHRDLKPVIFYLSWREGENTEDCISFFRELDLDRRPQDGETYRFGLAREESLKEMMTAETGTYRWMAPELYSTVTLRHGEKKHYNLKVDAYSFSIVLWELFHNKQPFQGMSNLQAAYAAAFKNERPSAEELPEDLALIVTSCWNEDPNARPDFGQIIKMLLHYLSTLSQPVFPPHMSASKNAVFLPDSPGLKGGDYNMDSKSEEEMPFPKIITKEIPMGTEMVRTEKKEEPVAAPVMPMPVRQTSAAKTTCLCSPTTHAGSFVAGFTDHRTLSNALKASTLSLILIHQWHL